MARCSKKRADLDTLAWYGGILGMATALNKFGFFMWMAKLLQTYVDFSSFSHIGLLLTMVALGTACRYLFVSCGAYMASVLPVQFTIGLAAGLPTMGYVLGFYNLRSDGRISNSLR